MKTTNNNEVVFFEEPLVNLKMVMAINDTTLGPALTNIRMESADNMEESIKKTLKLAYYNTYRSALLHKNFGGAGISIINDSKVEKNEIFLRAIGIIINKLNGNIFLLRSSDFSHKQMLDISRETKYLLGVDENYITSGNSPVEVLTRGMMQGMKALANKYLGQNTLKGLTFAVQGLGQIGSKVVEELLKIEDTKLIITDVVYDKIKIIQDKSSNVQVVKAQEIYNPKCHFFVSCAHDNIIEKENIQQLNCKILTGSANEIIANEELENELSAKGIVYVPGFIINGGDIISANDEMKCHNYEVIEKHLSEIYDVVTELCELAEINKQSLKQTAFEVANKYIENIAKIKRLK